MTPSEEKLTEWERRTLATETTDRIMWWPDRDECTLALIAEVRAARAREAEWAQAAWDAYGTLGFDRDGDETPAAQVGWGPDSLRAFAADAREEADAGDSEEERLHLEYRRVSNEAREKLQAERDVLQQRIDKALELSEYERDNLLALLKAVSGWAGPSVLSTANTGDWVMQVAGKLNPAGPEEGDWGRPNMSAEGIVRAVNERVAAIRCIKEETSDE